ncbi:hypothetical protein GBAR_LOCUS20197, partial [Geodia barretti]
PELRLDVVGVHVPAAVLTLVVPHGSLDPDARCAGYDSRDSLRRIGRRLPLLLAELDTSTGGRRGLSLQLAAETIRTDQLLREMYAVEFLHNCRVLQLETRVVPAVCPSSWAGPRSSRCHPPRFSTQQFTGRRDHVRPAFCCLSLKLRLGVSRCPPSSSYSLNTNYIT